MDQDPPSVPLLPPLRGNWRLLPEAVLNVIIGAFGTLAVLVNEFDERFAVGNHEFRIAVALRLTVGSLAGAAADLLYNLLFLLGPVD